MVCVCCVVSKVEDSVEVAGVKSRVVCRVESGECWERMGASCASVSVLIDLRNLLL